MRCCTHPVFIVNRQPAALWLFSSVHHRRLPPDSKFEIRIVDGGYLLVMLDIAIMTNKIQDAARTPLKKPKSPSFSRCRDGEL